MKSNKNSIKDIVLALTYQCNSCCKFCNIWKSKKTFSLLPEDYKNIPQSVKNINLSGGEPFLRKDLPQIIKSISRQVPKAKIIISTNGFKPSLIKKNMQQIIKFKRDIGVAVSIDGFGKVHEDLRGVKGGYSLALESIRLLKELGIQDIKIAFTLGNYNIDQLKRVYRLSQELKVEFSLAIYHNSAHYFSTSANKVSKIKTIKKELLWLIEQELKSYSLKRWLRAYFTWGVIWYLENKERILPDYSGKNSLFIDSYGNIYPSDVWSLRLGKLQEIKDWKEFQKQAGKQVDIEKAPVNWMVCTARQAIKKHWFQVISWIIVNKMSLILTRQTVLEADFSRLNLFTQAGKIIKKISIF